MHGDAVSQPYWDAAEDGRLCLQRCAACAAVRHYPQLLCPRCGSREVAWFDATGRGTVHTWTVAHHAFDPAFQNELPYTLVTIDLDEGPRLMGRLDPIDSDRLRIGLKVRVRFRRHASGRMLPWVSADRR